MPFHALLSQSWRAREQARLALGALLDGRGLVTDEALAHVVETASRILEVERVGIWRLDRERAELVCMTAWDNGPCDERPTLPVGSLGAYESALLGGRAMAVSDVRKDPLTSGLVDSYFGPHRIVSLLDVPIWLDGAVFGVACHEHRGDARTWRDYDAELAVSVAEMATLVLRTAQLREAQEALRSAEEQVASQHRRDSLTRLARGVAHDLKNLLAVISTTAGLLERRPGEETAMFAASTLHDVVDSATLLCDRLARTRPAVGEVEPDRVIEAQAAQLRALAAGREVAFRLEAGDAKVLLSRVELEQLLANFVVNAREATSDGGHLEIRTWTAPEPRDPDVRVLFLEVADDGVGMDALTGRRVFDPYFSTKEGDNRGNGLATVLDIVEGAGGTVTVDSEPGRGATFSVRLAAK